MVDQCRPQGLVEKQTVGKVIYFCIWPQVEYPQKVDVSALPSNFKMDR